MGRGSCQELGLVSAVIAAALLVACPAPEEPTACPIGQVQDIDTGECVPEHCGAEVWGLVERTGETIHVAPWGDDSWDGSERWPYRTIQQGADEAGDAGGGLVAVAAGAFVENLELDGDHDGVEIAGRCAELVIIDGSGEEEPGVRITGGELGIRGVTVTAGEVGVLVVRPGFSAAPEVQVEQVVVAGNVWFGLVAVGAGTAVDLEDATIRDTLPLPDGTIGGGIGAQKGARLVARGLLLEGNHDVGLAAFDAGTSVELENATIRDTLPLPDGTGGRGLHVQEAASLVAEDLLVERNREAGLVATDTGTTVNLDNATIRDTQPRPDGRDGLGVSVEAGASLVARGLLLEGNHDLGLLARDSGTTVDLDETRITGTQAAADSAGGSGIAVQDDASLSALGLEVQDNEGPGLYVVTGGTLEAWDAALERNSFASAVVMGGGRVTLHGGMVSGSTLQPSEGGGVGVFGWDLVGLPDIEVDGVAFSNLAGPALYLRGPGRYVMRDCKVQDSGSWPLPGGVLAVEGVEPWHEVGDTGVFSGLLLEGNTFSDLSSDAILLDSSSATLDLHPETGQPNTFSNLEGVPLVWQRCDGVEDPEILDGSVGDPACEPVPRTLGPLLEYRLWLAEVEPLE